MKMFTALFLFLSFIPLTFSQVFVTEKSMSELEFSGTLLESGVSKKAILTFRETPKTQELLVVFEVVDFIFADSIQNEEFNEVFMESMIYPQIRISGTIKDKIDLLKDGIYVLEVPVRMSIRRNIRELNLKIRFELTGTKMTAAFEQVLNLTDFQIPYAGPASEIGTEATLRLQASLLKR